MAAGLSICLRGPVAWFSQENTPIGLGVRCEPEAGLAMAPGMACGGTRGRE